METMTRDVGTQSTPPDLSSSSLSPASTPPITERSLKRFGIEGGGDFTNSNAKVKPEELVCFFQWFPCVLIGFRSSNIHFNVFVLDRVMSLVNALSLRTCFSHSKLSSQVVRHNTLINNSKKVKEK